MKTQTIYHGIVAGVSHARPDFEHFNAEDEVRIIFEPNNKFDQRAVGLYHPQAGRIGYVPRDCTGAFHDANENGFPMTAKLLSFDESGKFPKIIISVTISIP